MFSSLLDLAREESPEAKGALMVGIAELFVRNIEGRTSLEQNLFGDVTLLLYPSADTEYRQRLSNDLSKHAQVPKKLAMHLARDEIKVALPMLAESQALTPVMLAELAGTCSQSHLQALARRPDLQTDASDMLVKRGDMAVLRLLAANKKIALSRQGLMLLAGAAETDDVLLEDLVQRKDLPPAVCQRLLPLVEGEAKGRLKGIIEGALSQEQLDQITRLRALRRDFGPALDNTDIRKLWNDAQQADILIDDLVILMLQDNRLSDVCELIAIATRRAVSETRKAIFDGNAEQVIEIALSAGLESQTVALLGQARCKHLKVQTSQTSSWTKGYAERLEALRANANRTPEFAAKRRGKHSKGRGIRNQRAKRTAVT
ncbi:uncharacterized protein (DUF2336 family) [Roseibium hamelinense]|uniref:Uncharacterized protein (DUF2336 family) n=1 Tax=Roseibium hamelinense TaxID=150831 RepID=A0A562SLK9_9HYPH|nr:DUF2336 domain-containing protein [Roseibium hamelinense]MTI44926.1 DUF2336 domain-containing protein [Roseibium hamelinense]TWI82187.1 uncharacterized protein (DUF2336 family) [Roseibium hamelinense]